MAENEQRQQAALDAANRPVLDVAQVVELERRIAEAGTSLAELMQRAGTAVADAAREILEQQDTQRKAEHVAEIEYARALAHDASVEFVEPEDSEFEPLRVVVLCGSGNNGGDGWVAAQLLARNGYDVTVVTKRPAAGITAQPARDAALTAERELSACDHARILVSPDILKLGIYVSMASMIVDAILGTGFSGAEVRAPYASWIITVHEMRPDSCLVVAADVPSGLSAQTGTAATPCVAADLTVTMIVPKTGLVTPRATRYCGELRVAPLAPIEGLLEE